ncbi:hypothetical protein D9758_015176 [Tetrapyrgos nigripes]|uniref:Nucleoprotein TPR/MLP1 domain-containing protein n=1 Tax=Tetrapyrgos nigripes TaxID=182062 RepID=A0A8H5C129_9AGAR|nr:hypothetical protein D9758_015176 [Tetrapyrgos nigripes]
MVDTRRKSKAAHADSDAPSGSTSTDTVTVPIPEALDVESLKSLIPDVDVHSPSPEAIVSLYQFLLQQASELDSTQRELDEARAEAERKDVELDQALQDRESGFKDLEVQLENLQGELKIVKQERDQLLASQSELQARISTLSTSQSSSSTEVETLKVRLEDTEREKRDLVVVISRLKQEGEQHEQEIQTLRSNLKEARQEHQSLESQVRETRSGETATKFKVDSLTQQLQLAQSEVERLNEELTAKASQFTDYRRSKQAELSTLQATYDDLTQKHSSLETSMKALQASYTTQNHSLTQALTKVQDLTGQLAEQEATYSSEANSLRRLVTMLEEREKQAKEIVDNIEREWDGLGQRAEERENALRDEIEREKRRRENAEKKNEQLEKVLEKMGRGELPLPGDGPGTPSRRASGALDEVSDGMMGISPTVAMASRVQRSGKSFTEVYADYVKLQEDFARKSAEYDHMDKTLTAVLAQIEERAPILSQQRIEYERLTTEVAQVSAELSQAIADRDAQASLAQDNAQRLSKSTRENELLQKQLDDLGRQVRNLLKEITRRDDPNLPSDEEMENVPSAEDVETVITNHLVLFKSIDGLQEQNQKLLKIVRELAQKLESEEKEYRETMEKEQGEAIREALEAMQELEAKMERQKKASDSTIQAYMKERDMFKMMLARYQKGEVVNGTTPQTNGAGPSSDLEKELADIQSQFDAYRMEMGHDSGRLRDEVVNAQREVAQLQASLAKGQAKIEYLTEHNRMNQEQYKIQGQEMDDIRTRNAQLLDQWTRVDIDYQRASEELVSANARVEQLRNESANLRAEKKIWESIQGRLVEENKTLAMERSYLSDLMNNVQKMHNDLERSGENDRRRLESQLQLMENQAQDLRVQLTQERDAVRNITLQKDIEVRELQNRVEKSAQELAKTRESLVMAETSKTHLEERIGDLNKHLQGNEEKLAVYERRPGAIGNAGPSATSVSQDMSREQQLEAEVAELRSALKVAELDLATARSHVQQFKEISQANETALSDLNNTFDEYKASTEAQIARLESERAGLEEKLASAQQELASMTSKYNEVQGTYENERVAWTNDKKLLEDMIAELSSSERVSETDRTSRENDLRQQEERAKSAEERYSNEVIAHAETIKALDNLKKQLTTIQATVREHQTSAETANSKLLNSQVSWSQQKEALDKEVADLKARCDDITKQNNLLHHHLESVSSQAARIRQAADTNVPADAGGEAQPADGADTKLSELRSVVAYLRKEKEIVDLQLELSKQENTRLKTQIDHLQQTLHETRQTLSEERERAVENAASTAQHNELVERINQLNILRESNATLRADCETHQKRSKALEERLKTLHKQLEPVKEEARVAQAELQAKVAQVKRLEEENRRWQERNQQLLGKYDRIDPSEMQALKDEIEQLKTQKAEVETTVQQRDEELKSLKEHVEKVEKSVRDHREMLTKTNQSAKNRIGELNSQRSTLMTQKKELETKVEALETKVEALEKEQQEMQATKAALDARIASLEAEKSALVAGGATAGQADAGQQAVITALQEERDKLLAEKSSWTASASGDASTTGAVDDQLKQAWETEKATLIKDRDDAQAQVQTTKAEAERFANVARNNKTAFDKLRSDTARIRAADAEKAAADLTAAVEKTRSEMQTTSAPSDEQVKKLQEELQTIQQRLTQKHQQELKAAVEAAKKEAPNAGASGTDSAAIAAAIAAHDKEREAKLQEEIAAAVERGRLEAGSKVKLKDAQILRIQNRLKEYEAQILAWKESGLLPQEAKMPGPAARPPQASASVANAASSSTAPANAATSTPAASNTLPRKPPVQSAAANAASASAGPSAASTSAPGPVPAVGVGRGRGAAPTARGAARGLPIRGAAAGRGGAPAPAAKLGQPLSGGVQIHGAANANKRPAAEPAESDSLAKRLKPAAAQSGPVKLNRPGPPPS